MNRFFLFLFFLMSTVGMQAQGVVRGRVLDRQADEVMQFVNIRVTDASGKMVGGAMTDMKGSFQIANLKDGQYTLQVSKALQYLLFGVLALAFIALAAFLVKSCLPKEEEELEQLPLEDTSAMIESVRPKGELYLYSLVAEDFVTKQETERHALLFPESHSCVQVVQQKISFVLDLDQVTYTPDSGNVVLVRLPDIKYVASTQDSRFMSDDEDYWKDHDTDPMKRAVENKLKKKYDTPKIRKQAQANAQKAVSELLSKFGYEVRFVSGNIERKDGVESLKSVQ